MRIEDIHGRELAALDDWAVLYDTPRERRHWKQHRSAFSIADFILNYDGAEIIRSRISATLEQEIRFDRIVPEYEVSFDGFGRGRMHDLGIFGQSDSGDSVFVGVEAKVDETFNVTVREAYLKAKANQIAGVSTNAPERIEKLLAMHFGHFEPPRVPMFDVRYQLLYATAGTLAQGADISVLFVAVFKTRLYSELLAAENFRDYIQFMTEAGATPIKLADRAAAGHELELDGRKLTCLYESFEL